MKSSLCDREESPKFVAQHCFACCGHFLNGLFWLPDSYVVLLMGCGASFER